MRRGLTLIAVSRSMWYSAFESVCDGAMTIESPVCTTSGSKFSMLHTVMQLSAASRTTSYSTYIDGFGGGTRFQRALIQSAQRLTQSIRAT